MWGLVDWEESKGVEKEKKDGEIWGCGCGKEKLEME